MLGKSKAWWKHVKMVKIPRIQYKPRQIHSSPWGALGPWEHRLFLALSCHSEGCYTCFLAGAFNPQNAGVTKNIEMLQHLQPLGHILKVIGPIEVEKNTKHIKVYQSHACGEWSILANTSQMTGWADIDCRYFNRFNHVNLCVCCWKLKLCMTCF